MAGKVRPFTEERIFHRELCVMERMRDCGGLLAFEMSRGEWMAVRRLASIGFVEIEGDCASLTPAGLAYSAWAVPK